MPFHYANGRDNAAYEPTGQTKGGRPVYCVTESFSYSHGQMKIVVPVGFLTDLASIPTLPFFPNPAGTLWDDAAIVHDAALRDVAAGDMTRREADAIFFYALRDRGCSRFTAWVFWAAVRLNGAIK